MLQTEILTKSDAVEEMLQYLELDFTHGDTVLEYREQPECQGLSVEKTAGCVHIVYSEPVYLYRALGLVKEQGERKCYSIRETARFTMNGPMLDCSRGAVLSVPALREMLRQLALMGHNTVMLYTEDTYEIDGEPYFGYMRGRYTVEELRELDDYADRFGIRLVPCIQTLGHLAAALRWDPYKAFSDTSDILLVDDERTYVLIESMLKTCRKAYRSDRIHVGLDETHFMGRGKYYDLHGDSNKTELFQRHLRRVTALCEKYGFRPMIWGDMLFRIAGYTDYTDSDMSIDSNRLEGVVPDTVDFVYWDYYSVTAARYAEFIQAHKKLSDHVIFAGGAWRWANFAPNLTHSLESSRNALSMCARYGIREVFTTLWGDDGSESSIYSCWPVMQLFAEYNFHDQVDEAHLARRFATCTGGNWEDFMKLELVNQPLGRQDGKEDNPGKYLFYQDPLLGLFDYHVKPGFNAYYAETAKILWDCAGRAKKHQPVFSALAALCDVLAEKSELGLRLKQAYDDENRSELETLTEDVIPRVVRAAERFRKYLEQQWMEENKPFGFDMLDKRIGGVIQRLKTARERVTNYLTGRVRHLEELEESRLPYNGQADRATVYVHQPSNWNML